MNEFANFVARMFGYSDGRQNGHMRSAESLALAQPAALEFQERIRKAFYTESMPLFGTDCLFVANHNEAYVNLPMLLPIVADAGRTYAVYIYFRNNALSNVIMIDDTIFGFHQVGDVYVADINDFSFDFDTELTKERIQELVYAAYKVSSAFDRYGTPIV